MKKNKGFTLIELLVVISIIAILSIIGMTAYGNVQKSARDAKRRGDVDSIAKAMEVHYNGTGNYICVAAGWFTGGSVPLDPVTSNAFNPSNGFYKFPWCDGSGNVDAGSGSTATSWIACAHLETNGGNASDWNGTGASGASATYYCIKNQQ